MGAGCYGTATSTTLWDKDPASWKGVLPLLPPFKQPEFVGDSSDTKLGLDFAQKELDSIIDKLPKALKAKKNWLMSSTNGVNPTATYVVGNTYQIFLKTQAFIGQLNLLPNHDPNTQTTKPTSSGDSDPVSNGGTQDDVASFMKALLLLDSTTLANETIPQDPEGDGQSVPIFEYDPATKGADKVE